MSDANYKPIPFTQFFLPDGREKQVNISRPDAVYESAMAVIARGYRFECEILTTGEVSLTVSDPEEGVDLLIEVCPNGPDVPKAVDRLVHVAWVNLDPANRVMEVPHE